MVDKKTIEYLYKRRPLRLERPRVLQFPVIDICNSKCQMCYIWKNKDSPVLDSTQVLKAFANPLFRDVEAVGLNGGEPTLRRDIGELAAALIASLPKLRTISLITNAINIKQVKSGVERVATACCTARKVRLDLMVSLDGVGEVHDKVRGRVGNFESAKEILRWAKTSGVCDSLRIGCTIIRDNAKDLWRVHEFAHEEGIYVKYRIGIPHQRLHTQDVTVPFALRPDERAEIIEFLYYIEAHYEQRALQRLFYRNLIGMLAGTSSRTAGCDWKHRGATVTPDGQLLYCAVESPVIVDSVLDPALEKKYFKGERLLADIVSNKCKSCHHDYEGVPDRIQLWKIVFEERLRLGALLAGIRSSTLANLVLAPLNRVRRCHAQKLLDDKINRSIQKIEIARPLQMKVLICGWYGTETLGDKAILGGVLAAFRNIYPTEDYRYAIASLHPYITEATKFEMPELKSCEVLSGKQALETISQYSVVVIGGGPLMAIPEIKLIRALMEQSHLRGALTVAAGVGVGPLGDRCLDRAIVDTLNLCKVRVFRDQSSMDLYTNMGGLSEANYVSGDPARDWVRAMSAGAAHARNEFSEAPRRILLGLREYPYAEYGSHNSRKRNRELSVKFERAMIQMVNNLSAIHLGMLITPVPMCTNHFGSDDRVFYRRLFAGKQINNPSSISWDYCREGLAPIEYLGAFRDSAVLVGMRFHSLVFGIEMGIPCVAIDYTDGFGKVASLCKLHKVPAHKISDINVEKLIGDISCAMRASESKGEDHNVRSDRAFADVLKDAIWDAHAK